MNTGQQHIVNNKSKTDMGCKQVNNKSKTDMGSGQEYSRFEVAKFIVPC